MAEPGSGEMRTALWVGGIVTTVGALALVGYGVYDFSRDFFGSHDVALVVKVAVPAVALGLLILLGVVLMDRLRDRKRERFEEVDY